MSDLENCLEDLERRINPEVEDALLAEWKTFAAGEYAGGDIFRPVRPRGSPSKTQWPAIRVNATLDDFDAMALQQYKTASDELERGGGRLMMVRSNHGTPILAMPFGCRLFVMPDETDTLPACHPVEGGAQAIQAIVDRGVPDLERHPYIAKVLEMGRRYRAIQAKYPRVARYVPVYHPDTQGPMDLCELIWGADLFLDLYDEAQLVHALLDLVTRTYTKFMRLWWDICPPPADGFGFHWGMLHRGSIMLRDDSAMNLSPAMFEEFVRPYDQRVLTTLGGGAMHACGKVDHFSGYLAGIKGLHALNLTQPHLNNMEKVFAETVDRGLLLLAFDRGVAEKAVAAGRRFKGRLNTG